MCGLAGFVEREPGRGGAELACIATAMGEAIRHRGPDDDGTWCDPAEGVALASRRLAVIDLSAAGHQPMASPGGRFRLVFNGEIYNHLELRRDLPDVAWRGHSDTEVLAAGIERWGVRRALERTVGMFAIAAWDARDRTITLARDRMGEKPLYYGWQRGSFLFGSELKALREHPDWEGELDRDALAAYLRLGYVASPWSAFRGIRQLAPGTFVTASADTLRTAPHSVKSETWWSLEDAVRRGIERPFEGDDAEAANELERVLGDAVAGQMVADVPLGAFLSGGIDSSTIVALMQARSSVPVRTFTIGFQEEEHDEKVHAARVAAHLGTTHETLVVTPAEAAAVIPALADAFDEPFADPSMVPTYLVAKLARTAVTVSLSGDGGDELFGGYNRYVWTRNAARALALLPGPLRRVAARAVRAVPARAWGRALRAAGPLVPAVARREGAGERVHRLAGLATARDATALYGSLVSLWPSPDSLVIGAHEPDVLRSRLRAPEPPWRDLVEKLQYLDGVTYLPDDILVKVDRAAMAVSLESRVPMLDHRVVELAWRMPPRLKLQGATGKLVLRRVLERHVPRAMFDRPKTGFGMPVSAWLRTDLRDWAESLLAHDRLARGGVLEPGPVRAAWAGHLAGRPHPYRLWAVLMLSAWLERWSAKR
jgi:asparagine synthase (glutamine-hydrolysing)